MAGEGLRTVSPTDLTEPLDSLIYDYILLQKK